MAKAKPIDRAAQALATKVRDLHAVGLPAEVAVLDTGHTIEVIRAGSARDGKKVDHDIARRKDVFLIIDMPQASFEAARRLERDMLARRGEDDRGPSAVVVDATAGLCRQDRMLLAGDRVHGALIRIGGRDSLLLSELICPAIRGEAWRDTVFRVTRETNPVSQATVIRSACANLAAGYAVIDGGGR